MSINKVDNKIYCFQWNVTNNQVFRQEYEYTETKYGDIFFSLGEEDDSRDVFLTKLTVELEQEIDAVKIDGETYMYIYTFKDDVNRALELFYQENKKMYEKYKKATEFYEGILDTLSAKQKEIKAKYPEGVKNWDQEEVER